MRPGLSQCNVQWRTATSATTGQGAGNRSEPWSRPMTEPVTVAVPTLTLRLGPAYQRGYEEAVSAAIQAKWAERIHDRDASVWSYDVGVQAAIGERLGWLDAPNHFESLIPAIEAFGE